MRIYLAQDGKDLNGGGHSYGLIKGGQPFILVSFAAYLDTGQMTIHRPGPVNRRVLVKRNSRVIENPNVKL